MLILEFSPTVCNFLKINLFFNFWLCWVFVAVHGLSLVMASGGYSSLQCAGFSLQQLLLLRSTGSRHTGFSSCGTRDQQLWLVSSRAQAQQLGHTGLIAPWHVGSSRTRARTHVPCIGRRILNHCATSGASVIFKLLKFVSAWHIKRFDVCCIDYRAQIETILFFFFKIISFNRILNLPATGPFISSQPLLSLRCVKTLSIILTAVLMLTKILFEFHLKKFLFLLKITSLHCQDPLWAVTHKEGSTGALHRLLRASCAHCSPALCSVRSPRQLDIQHGVGIYTMEIGKCYKSDFFSFSFFLFFFPHHMVCRISVP